MKPTSEELFDREPDVGDYCLWGFLLFKVSGGLFSLLLIINLKID